MTSLPRFARATFTGGRRHALSAAQLWRTHLLTVLTSTHSLNLVVAQLPEQAGVAAFRPVAPRTALPLGCCMSFGRQLAWMDCARSINIWWGDCCVGQGVQPHAVALMDATDLPAACSGFKKKFCHLHRRARGAGRTHPQDRARAAGSSATRNTRCGYGCPRCIRR